MRRIFFIILLLFGLFLQGQLVFPWKYDFGFEKTAEGQLPDEVRLWGSAFDAKIQDVFYKEGHHALLITKTDPSQFAYMVFEIPHVFKAKSLEFTAYLKLEDVKQGYASLFVQMDGHGKTVLRRSNINNLSGTKDWQLYSTGNITLPSKVDKIYVGVVMTGVGKLWVDALDLRLDGKNLQQASIHPKKLKPADLDTAFSRRTLIPFFSLNDTLKEDLLTLCKIWGFIKYYHPQVRAGLFNMDNELLRFLPSYILKTHTQRQDTLHAWIQHFGSIEKKGKRLKITRASIVIPSYTWLDDTVRLKKETSIFLKNILNAKRKPSSYYLEFDADGRPVFQHERTYEQAFLADKGMIILTLFRIHAWLTYFYPYASLMKDSPDQIFTHFLPYLLEAQDENTVRYYLLELVAKLKDSQAVLLDRKDFYSTFWGKNQANYLLSLIDGMPVIAGYIDPALDDKTGLRVGDVIRDVNGQLPRILYENFKKYIPASNESYYRAQLVSQLLRTNNTSLNVTITRDRKLISRVVPCYSRTTLLVQRSVNSNIPAWRFVTPEIGYVDLTLLKPADVPVAMRDLYLSMGLILDARNLQSDELMNMLLPYFVSKSLIYAKETRNDPVFVGHHVMQINKKISSRIKSPYQKRVVVLINEGTKGGGERLVMALRACPQVIIVGNTTAGAPALVASLPLPGGMKLFFSSIGLYWPDGKMVHGDGIRIDEHVQPSIEGLIDRRDEMLEKAAMIIQTKK